MQAFSETVQFIWEVADLLRGDFKAPEYETVVLPFTVLRRFDCVLEGTRDAVRVTAERYAGAEPGLRHRALLKAAEAPFYNTAPDDLTALAAGSAVGLDRRLLAYIEGFDPASRAVLQRMRIEAAIARLSRSGLLWPVVRRFAGFGLYPPGRTPPGRRAVDNHEMGYIFEELIRKFREQTLDAAGEHFTPREVVRLIIDLLFAEDADRLAEPGVRTLFDPACGTGGMLSAAEEYVAERLPAGGARIEGYGQEVNDDAYAICLADAMLKGHDASDRVRAGNSLTADAFADATFDYCISNPPYGVSWKKVREPIEAEAALGHAGRFGAGLPRISDGSLLFLQHMIAKMKGPAQGGTRIAVIFAGSPLFTGVPGSGESEIRRWIISNDWLEAVVSLPPGLFYNTGIRTYVWLVTNRKHPRRRGRVQLVDASDCFERMDRSLGDKRNRITRAHIDEIVRLYRGFAPGTHVRIFDNRDFGFRRVVVHRPLRLRFRVDAAAIERVRTASWWARLGTGPRGDARAAQTLKEGIVAVLEAMDQTRVWRDREAFVAHLDGRLKTARLKLLSRQRRALVRAIGERDETAAPCLAGDGLPEPDPLLRDHEDVDLDEPIGAYLAREVLPYAADAWAEPSEARVGYQVRFERLFHTWSDPRSVADVEAELRALEARADALLAAVLDPASST